MEAIASFSRLSNDDWWDSLLSKALPRLSDAQRDWITEVAATAKYSPSYIGQLKPSGLVRAGRTGDRGYGIDTGRFTDEISQWQQEGRSLFVESTAPYASHQERLLQQQLQYGWINQEMAMAALTDVLKDAIAKELK